MLMKEPTVEFVKLNVSDTIATSGSGYTVCEKIYGKNVGDAEICDEYGDPNASQTTICGWFCDTSTANASNNSL